MPVSESITGPAQFLDENHSGIYFTLQWVSFFFLSFFASCKSTEADLCGAVTHSAYIVREGSSRVVCKFLGL